MDFRILLTLRGVLTCIACIVIEKNIHPTCPAYGHLISKPHIKSTPYYYYYYFTKTYSATFLSQLEFNQKSSYLMRTKRAFAFGQTVLLCILVYSRKRKIINNVAAISAVYISSNLLLISVLNPKSPLLRLSPPVFSSVLFHRFFRTS